MVSLEHKVSSWRKVREWQRQILSAQTVVDRATSLVDVYGMEGGDSPLSTVRCPFLAILGTSEPAIGAPEDLETIKKNARSSSFADTALIVMLETAEGIENCEAIASVEGIDVLLIGSGDLTTDFGIPGQVDHPRLRAAYERVAAACRTHSKVLGVGGIRHNTKLQGELIGLGARFVIAGTDTNYVLAGARQDTEALRAIKIG